MNKDVYGGNFPAARRKAIERSGGLCQLCGRTQATDAHHWANDGYPDGIDCTENDLTALCAVCHSIATEFRRFLRAGGSRWQFKASIQETLRKCDIESGLKEVPHSSCTQHEDLIQKAQKNRKSPSLPQNGEPTERQPTPDESKSLKQAFRSGLTLTDHLQSRPKQSGDVSKHPPEN